MKNDRAIEVLKAWDLNYQDEFTAHEFDEAFDMAIKTLEQQAKRGHWILTDVEGNKIWHCNCSECGKDPQDYIGGSENWWLVKSNLPKFCPSCGSDNSEVGA